MDTTIIILSYNSEKNIKNCFDEINKFKNYFNYNIVFVDNNSTDNTNKIIKSACKDDNRIKYIRYSKKYVPDEVFAKENKLGLWQGKFMEPEKWRKLN